MHFSKISKWQRGSKTDVECNSFAVKEGICHPVLRILSDGRHSVLIRATPNTKHFGESATALLTLLLNACNFILSDDVSYSEDHILETKNWIFFFHTAFLYILLPSDVNGHYFKKPVPLFLELWTRVLVSGTVSTCCALFLSGLCVRGVGK